MWWRQPSSRGLGKAPLRGRPRAARVLPGESPGHGGARARSSAGRWHRGTRACQEVLQARGGSPCFLSPSATVSQAAGEDVSWGWSGVDLLSRSFVQGPPPPLHPTCQLCGVWGVRWNGAATSQWVAREGSPEPERGVCDETASRRSLGRKRDRGSKQTPPGPEREVSLVSWE